MIRAAFFDIDGTLVSFKTHKVSEGTIKAFDELHKKGIRTFISTGRPQQIIPKMPVSFDGYITMNGGHVFVGDTILHSSPIPKDDAERWIRYAYENKITTFAFMPEAICLNQEDPALSALRAQLDFELPPIWTMEEMMEKKINQFIVMQTPDKDKGILELLPGCALPRWHPAFSDLIPKGISKAVGMQKILDHFGISQEETIAFGDGGNDIQMLDFAKIGVAMGNAADEVKEHADYVTTDVDNEGILNALKALEII